MSSFPISPYDRPGLAVSNLLGGKPGAAATALVAPEELGPKDTSSLSQRFLKTLGQEDNPLLKGIMSIATDPLVILSLFLSSKYPIAAADKLFKVGQKFAGYAHKIGPIEGLFGRAERFFANTPLPDLFLRFAQRKSQYEQKWGRKLNSIFDKFKSVEKRVPTRAEMGRVAAKLDKLDTQGHTFWPGVKGEIKTGPLVETIRLSPQEKRLYDMLRQDFFPSFHKEVIAPQLHKKGGSFFANLDQGGIGSLADGVDDFWPHTMKRTPGLEHEYALSQLLEAGFSEKQYTQMLSQQLAKRTRGAHAKRSFGILVPDLQELQEYGLKLNQTGVNNLHMGIKIASDWAVDNVNKFSQKILGRKLGTLEKVNAIKKQMAKRGIPLRGQEAAFDHLSELIAKGSKNQAMALINTMTKGGTMARKYTHNLPHVLENYINSSRHSFLWSVDEVPDQIAKEWDLPKNMSLGEAFTYAKGRLLEPSSRAILEQDYIPLLKGRLTESQVSSMLRWSNAKLKTLESLDHGVLNKWVPKPVNNWLRGMLTSQKSPLSYLNVNAKTASWFYYSALGFNPGSALQNLFQPLITTMPAVGASAFFKGIQNSTKKLGDYFELRAKNLVPDEAFARAFPEFAKSGMATQPITSSILQETLESAWAGAADAPARVLAGSGTRMEKLKKAAMFMFSKTEMANRVTTFEAGLAKAVADGLPEAKRIPFASKLVRATQFPAGPGQMPRALLKLSAPWRQFMYFPMRYAGFLMESTMYGGKNVRDWGTIARAAGTSAIAAKGAKEFLNADITRSLMTGAMPLPEYENAPFFPLPIVPPIASVAGAGIESVATQDLTPFKQASAILVPGGVAARRLYKTFSPKYAKYDQRTPDGRIPVYGENGALIRHYTPWELAMQGMGVHPAAKREEQDAIGYLVRHRDKIRDYRRSYVEAVIENNPEKAQRINAEFQSVYGMGPIELKPSDLRAARDRRMLTRIQRLLKTMPADYRPFFEEAVNTSFANQTGEMFPAYNAPPPSLPPYGSASPGSNFNFTQQGGFGGPTNQFGF